MKQNSQLKKYLIGAAAALTLVIAVAAFSVKPASVIAANANVQSNANANGNANNGGDSNIDNNAGLVHCGNNAEHPCNVADFFNLWIGVTNFGIDMAGIICVVVLIYSGWEMVFAAGNSEAVSSAKKRITNAFIGLIFVISAFVLVNFFTFRDARFRNPVDILADPLNYITSPSN